jgi:hypothetical protein
MSDVMGAVCAANSVRTLGSNTGNFFITWLTCPTVSLKRDAS